MCSAAPLGDRNNKVSESRKAREPLYGKLRFIVDQTYCIQRQGNARMRVLKQGGDQKVEI